MLEGLLLFKTMSNTERVNHLLKESNDLISSSIWKLNFGINLLL